jgi:hypothetical protein
MTTDPLEICWMSKTVIIAAVIICWKQVQGVMEAMDGGTSTTSWETREKACDDNTKVVCSDDHTAMTWYSTELVIGTAYCESDFCSLVFVEARAICGMMVWRMTIALMTLDHGSSSSLVHQSAVQVPGKLYWGFRNFDSLLRIFYSLRPIKKYPVFLRRTRFQSVFQSFSCRL